MAQVVVLWLRIVCHFFRLYCYDKVRLACYILTLWSSHSFKPPGVLSTWITQNYPSSKILFSNWYTYIGWSKIKLKAKVKYVTLKYVHIPHCM